MATKPHIAALDNTGSSVLAQFPPTISLASPVLASVISLPDNPLIAYSVYTGAPLLNVGDPLNLIELARRKILSRNAKHNVLESLLPSVHITKDTSELYVFAIGSADRTSESHTALAALQPDGLLLTETSSFIPTSIYPCSAICSLQTIPCSECLNPLCLSGRSFPSSAHLLPRESLRLPFHHFLSAVRDRLIDDITEASKLRSNCRQATRLKDGFLLGPTTASSEWGAGWEHHVRGRPLIHSRLEVQLSQSSSLSRLLVHPILRPTFYLPLQSSLSLPSGTPIILLPHGVPAYYLNTYAGPTSALTAQFEDSLVGLGAGDWKGTSQFAPQQNECDQSASSSRERKVTYIIAWLSVQNKQGEDKGMPIIWPVCLCLSYHPSSPSVHARTPLPYEPELPAQLQASPPPPAPAIPPGLSVKSMSTVLTDSTTRPGTPFKHIEHERLSTPISRRPRTLTSSPTTESLRAFRTLTLSTKPYTRDVQRVATDVSGYVDSVAKEREKERERMKRERESAGMRGRAGSTSGHPGLAVNTPSAQMQITPEAVQELPSMAVTTDLGLQREHVEPVMEQDVEVSPAFIAELVNKFAFLSPAGASTPSPTEEAMPMPIQMNMEVDQAEPNAILAHAELPANHRQDATTSFDPFSTFNAPWPQTSNDFMDLDMGYGMEFDMNMGSLGDSRSGVGDMGTFDMDDGFGVFTDDDFSFFDGPATQARTAAAPIPPHFVDHEIRVSEGLTPAAGPAPLGFSPQRVGELSGPGPPSVTVTQPWTPHPLAEGFTPRTVDFRQLVDSITPAPDLLPPSPTKTPSSHSAPATPTVQISEQQPPSGQKSSHLSLGPSIFDPIPFAPSHRLADSKYVFGKFALPSPPDSEDRTEAIAFPSSAPSVMSGWKLRYSVATDPRIGVMRKLIGVKRKSFDQGLREARMSPSWVREHEEWESSAPSPAVDDTKSDGESDEDEPWVDDDEVSAFSRPSTPPPSYLPIGPTLLQTQFHHARLLPLSSPLKPPGAAHSSAEGTVPMSVPTPVSPAAVIGTTSEKAKSLEAAAQILVKEVVENSVWADAWRANVAASRLSSTAPTEIWQADVKGVSRLLSSLQAVQSPVDLQALLDPDSRHLGNVQPVSPATFQQLEPPMFTVGKSETVIQVLPTALRFWEKLGLWPRAGKKDVTAYVLFDKETSSETQSDISQWLNKVSATYSVRNYGTHSPGLSDSCTSPGLIPVQFDSFRKTLVNCITTLPRLPGTYLVFYIITPSSVIALTSSVLRTLFNAIKYANKAHPDAEVLFHFVPEALVSDGLSDPGLGHGGLVPFVASVYDRILQPVERAMSRRLFTLGPRTRAYFYAPAFALACAFPSANLTRGEEYACRVSFTLDSHPSSLDVVGRHALLHVGYRLTPCGRWLLAACVDERGEAHELGAWLLPEEAVERFVVNQVWSFARNFAGRANVEWRVVLAKLGMLGASELHEWIAHLDTAVLHSSEANAMHVTLLAIGHEHPWVFLAPRNGTSTKAKQPSNSASSRSSSRTASGVVFVDAASTTYAMFPSATLTCMPALPSGLNDSPCTGSADTAFIPDREDEEPLHQWHPHARVLGMSMLIRVPAGSDHTSISTVNIYQLHAAHSLRSSHTKRSMVGEVGTPSVDDERQMLYDISRNYHALAVLAVTRWRLQESTGLPLHLAALETMGVALAGQPTES